MHDAWDTYLITYKWSSYVILNICNKQLLNISERFSKLQKFVSILLRTECKKKELCNLYGNLSYELYHFYEY